MARQIELAEEGVIDWVVQRINGPHLPPYLCVMAVESIGDLCSWCATYDGVTECYIVTTLSKGHDTRAEAYAKLKELEATHANV